ncbi:hypothetical protein PtA15_15A132 [Puccinia triticina]|uniref:Protein kinase domain-containing protein n=1 Tax=Puccinia triticina TaxID=208348 RepID=A0ABY7D2V8_9BASI|nr:uncharacterized protein PtA15_15A132 [Puccinia triticina]WAQ91741.1 hypothetical protein PtA15_15A132 [Puccinia triticina]
MDPTRNSRGVHFKPSSEQLHPKTHPAHAHPQAEHIQPWTQRHGLLTRLLAALPPSTHALAAYQHRKPPAIHSDDALALSPHLGYLLERAQRTHAPAAAEQRLLQRTRQAQIDPAKDFVLLRKISDGQSGAVHLVRTRLSSLESLNQTNLYILKTVSKRVSRRIQQLSILLLSRASGAAGAIKRLPELQLSFQTETELHLVLEYSASGSLADHVARLAGRPIGEGQLQAWAIDVLAALDWLHTAHRFCHRDVKPSNLLINHPDGHILLSDFATAAPLVRNPLSALLHVPPAYRVVIVGTCDYIAPEVLQAHLSQTIATLSHSAATTALGPAHPDGHPDADAGASYGPEIDLWSFGVSLFELVYSRLPFFCPSINDTYAKIVAHQVPAVRDGWSPGMGPGLPELAAADDGPTPVSPGLQSFLKALLCRREERLGCGPDGLAALQRHAWFGGVEWADVQRQPVPGHVRAATEIHRVGDSVCLDADPGAADEPRFDFSAFFGSSPGASVDPSDSSSSDDDASSDEEAEEVAGFTYLPRDPDAFNHAHDAGGPSSRQKLKSSIKRSASGARDDRFSTPIKPPWPHSSTPLDPPPPATAARSVRLLTRPDGSAVPLSHIDQLILLNRLTRIAALRDSIDTLVRHADALILHALPPPGEEGRPSSP